MTFSVRSVKRPQNTHEENERYPRHKITQYLVHSENCFLFLPVYKIGVFYVAHVLTDGARCREGEYPGQKICSFDILQKNLLRNLDILSFGSFLKYLNI